MKEGALHCFKKNKRNLKGLQWRMLCQEIKQPRWNGQIPIQTQTFKTQTKKNLNGPITIRVSNLKTPQTQICPNIHYMNATNKNKKQALEKFLFLM